MGRMLTQSFRDLFPSKWNPIFKLSSLLVLGLVQSCSLTIQDIDELQAAKTLDERTENLETINEILKSPRTPQFLKTHAIKSGVSLVQSGVSDEIQEQFKLTLLHSLEKDSNSPIDPHSSLKGTADLKAWAIYGLSQAFTTSPAFFAQQIINWSEQRDPAWNFLAANLDAILQRIDSTVPLSLKTQEFSAQLIDIRLLPPPIEASEKVNAHPKVDSILNSVLNLSTINALLLNECSKNRSSQFLELTLTWNNKLLQNRQGSQILNEALQTNVSILQFIFRKPWPKPKQIAKTLLAKFAPDVLLLELTQKYSNLKPDSLSESTNGVDLADALVLSHQLQSTTATENGTQKFVSSPLYSSIQKLATESLIKISKQSTVPIREKVFKALFSVSQNALAEHLLYGELSIRNEPIDRIQQNAAFLSKLLHTSRENLNSELSEQLELKLAAYLEAPSKEIHELIANSLLSHAPLKIFNIGRILIQQRALNDAKSDQSLLHLFLAAWIELEKLNREPNLVDQEQLLINTIKNRDMEHQRTLAKFLMKRKPEYFLTLLLLTVRTNNQIQNLRTDEVILLGDCLKESENQITKDLRKEVWKVLIHQLNSKSKETRLHSARYLAEASKKHKDSLLTQARNKFASTWFEAIGKILEAES